MKYIDAEKLIAKIEKRRNNALERQKNLEKIGQVTVLNEMIAFELNKILSFITSLQQEQPDGLCFIPLIRLIQKIPSNNWNNCVNSYAKKLCHCLIKEGYLKDANVLQSYISYMNGNNVPMATMDEQEQPKVDFEKELDRIWFDNKIGDYFDNDALDFAHIKTLCKHFYELGLNARKK